MGVFQAILPLIPMARTLKHLPPMVPEGPACVVRKANMSEETERSEIARLLEIYAREFLLGEAPEGGKAARAVEMVAGWQGAFVLVAAVGDRNAGFAICLPSLSTFSARSVVNVHDLWVDGSFRRRGVAKELLRCVQRVAEERGCSKVTLEVREDNPEARRLYRRHGFRGEPGSADAPGTYFLELVL